MPPFAQLSEDEIKDFISYITNNQEVSTNTDNVSNAEAVSQNNKATSSNSIFIFGASALILFIFVWLFRYKRKMNNLIKEMGYHSEPHSIPNYSLIFLAYFVLAILIIYFLVQGLNSKTSMLGILMFVVLPYLSFLIFLIGSIYRYKKRGFQVSSLSSQFLEGKKLYWGSLPFHWGIIILFFGHLIAFLFPRAVIAWNGEPVRLLILEISSFAFGLSAFLGLILLIKRRLGSQKLLVVANKMDMLVYTVLFTQIISGLGVAFFVRWGSSWFSSVLTPYLRSIFSFNPDINAVVEMPWLIQVHIISAFLIIGIIPFTRFVHFLVAPIDYIWRKYQIVVWNWNPKIIRVSRKYNFGKKPRNH
ncbi:MAG: respiratory nitrate reductase subunit gamma [Crocinitomicaceae bacterium]|nr:respiratory nitrate reductase subunit gamma [Crocinitomicaceae bacterium]